MSERVDWMLRFYHEVLGLDHLHYGLWNGEPLTLDGLRKAQERYVDRLLEMIHHGIHSVLDVGCGTGSVAIRLRDAGYEVEGLSPDRSQGSAFERRTGLPFHRSRFEDFSGGPYDLVLMSESAQYINLRYLFHAARRAAPEGRLLVADYFRVSADGGPRARSGHVLDEFVAASSDAHYRLEERRDVTREAGPTLDLARLLAEKHVLPGLELARDLIRERHPVFYVIGRRWARSHLDRLMADRDLLDRRSFERWKCYEMMQFLAEPRAT